MFENENVNYHGATDKKEKKKVNKMKDIFEIPAGQKSKIDKLEQKQKPKKTDAVLLKPKSKLTLSSK